MSDAPLHMDKWARNKRLYETLVGMGVFVEAVPSAERPDSIEYLIVSADLPQSVAARDVVAPVKRTKIEKVVASSARDGENVINFPPVV